jgi:tripartite-type tricarboxylate transporter receptor subunit TctC
VNVKGTGPVQLAMRCRDALLIGAFVVLVLLPRAEAFYAAALFYEGKTLTIIQGRSAGGLGDVRVRSAIPYLKKYLPGNPHIISIYVASAGGIQAGNMMAKTIKNDGLTIANIGTSIFVRAASKDPTVQYRLSDFTYLGAPSVGGPYALLMHRLGIDSLAKLKAHNKLRIAERSVGHTMYNVGRIMAFVLELKDPQWVVGYESPEVDIAVQRGEADGRTEVLYDLVHNKPNWRQEGFTVPALLKNIKGRGGEAVPGFPKTETVNDYADTQLKKDVLRFYQNSRPGSSVYFTQKGIPEEAAVALRQAFRRLWSDPQFAKDYERMTAEPLEAISGEEIEKFLQDVPEDAKVKSVMQQLLGAGPIPPAK